MKLKKIVLINSKRMRWAGNVARMGRKRIAYRTSWVNPKL